MRRRAAKVVGDVIAVRPGRNPEACWLSAEREALPYEPRIAVVSLSGVPGSNTRELAESLASALGGRIVSVGRRPPATAPLDLVIVERADLSPWEELVEPLARLSCPVAVVSTPA